MFPSIFNLCPTTIYPDTANIEVTKSATTAEIIWVLKSVVSGYSNSSCDGIPNTLKAMCPDSQIANDFKVCRLKLMYIVKYGIAPYFKQLLDAKLKKAPLYTLSFDESLNEITQESEMVVMVQYWDEEENEVRTRYLGSTFLGHSTAVDLMDKLNEVIKHLDPEKLYQISMDGPAVNIKFLNEFKLKREENAFHSIIDIGTCSLHTVHGSVKTAFDKSNMKIKETLKAGPFSCKA